MDIIWAPWRMRYILGDKTMGCFLCEAVKKGPGEETLLLHLTRHSLVILNRYPYISGHLMVVPRAHVDTLKALSGEELLDLHETLRMTVEVVEETLRPDGINLGMNLGKAAGAGLKDHIHYHVVPRFIGDNNSFTVLADTRVIPESLIDTYRRYLPAFKEVRA